MQPLRTIKITQPLGTKINHATSWDKKNHVTSREKKLGNLSGQQKNQATSRDKKSRNLKKSSNISGQKKSMQSLRRTKNIMQNYAPSWDKKKNPATSRTTNHATSWDKKITQPLGNKKIKQSLKTTKKSRSQ